MKTKRVMAYLWRWDGMRVWMDTEEVRNYIKGKAKRDIVEVGERTSGIFYVRSAVKVPIGVGEALLSRKALKPGDVTYETLVAYRPEYPVTGSTYAIMKETLKEVGLL